MCPCQHTVPSTSPRCWVEESIAVQICSQTTELAYEPTNRTEEEKEPIYIDKEVPTYFFSDILFPPHQQPIEIHSKSFLCPPEPRQNENKNSNHKTNTNATMIVYCVICRAKDAAVLVELSTPDLKGNAPQVTTALLEHLRDHPQQLPEGDLRTYVNRSSPSSNNSSRSNNSNNPFGADPPAQNDIFSTFLSACTIPITSVTQDGELDLGNIQEHYFHVTNYEGVFFCCLSDDAIAKVVSQEEEIVHLNDMDTQLVEDIWYSGQEYADIKADFAATLHLLDNEKPLPPASDHEPRGLEIRTEQGACCRSGNDEQRAHRKRRLRVLRDGGGRPGSEADR